MPTYDKNNPLTFPVRIFGDAIVTKDKATGEETWTGDYVEFTRRADEVLYNGIAGVLDLAKRKAPKSVAAIFDKPQVGETDAIRAMATLREVKADPRAAALAIKDVRGGTVVFDKDGETIKVIDPIAEEPIK